MLSLCGQFFLTGGGCWSDVEVLAVARRLTGGECAGAGAEVRLLRPPALPPGRPLPRQVRVPRVSVSVLSGVVASVEDVGVIADISCGRDTEQC